VLNRVRMLQKPCAHLVEMGHGSIVSEYPAPV
jgi:hypothetical protein